MIATLVRIARRRLLNYRSGLNFLLILCWPYDSGKVIRSDEPADEYLARLRCGWE
jgi:hypothetical protein